MVGKSILIDVPDLVLFDPTLADIPDAEFIHKLRHDPRTSTIPLVALSSDPSPFRRQTCLSGRSLSRISLPLIQKANLIILIVSTDQSTVKLTKTVWDYLQTQGVNNQNVYAILNRAVGLEGLTKVQSESLKESARCFPRYFD